MTEYKRQHKTRTSARRSPTDPADQPHPPGSGDSARPSDADTPPVPQAAGRSVPSPTASARRRPARRRTASRI